MDSSRELELKEENQKLRQELAWIHALMRNDTIQPREKVVLYETRYELLHSQRDEKGVARLYVWKVSDETGISHDSVGKSLKLLAENGVIERKPTYVQNQITGQGEKAIFVGLTDVARNPSKISFPSTNRGGKRTKKFCTSCGHSEHIEHKQCTCTACGTVFEDTWKTIDVTGDTEEEPNV